jgi:hypothetical protein
VAQLEDDVQAAQPAALTFAQVQDFVTRMERLAAGVEDLQPYYLLAPESIRPQLAQLGRPKKSPALLAGAIARLRTELQEPAEAAPATDGPKPSDFDNLSRRLAEAVHRLN